MTQRSSFDQDHQFWHDDRKLRLQQTTTTWGIFDRFRAAPGKPCCATRDSDFVGSKKARSAIPLHANKGNITGHQTMKHLMLLLGLAAASAAQAQITCQHYGNTTTCNDAPFGAPVVTPQMDIAAVILAKRRADAEQTAADAQMIQAQAQAQLARSQIEAQRARQTAPPPEQGLAAMSPDAGHAQIGMQAAQASTDTLRQALPEAQHLCETTGSDVYCDTAKIGEKELAWRAAHQGIGGAAPINQKNDDAATWARIEAREARHRQEAKP